MLLMETLCCTDKYEKFLKTISLKNMTQKISLNLN